MCLVAINILLRW